MDILTLGLNHTSAPLSLRERVAFAGEQLPLAIGDLHRAMRRVAPESAIISTCNRTEIVCASAQAGEVGEQITRWLSHRQGVAHDALLPHLYVLPGREAVRHAFRVASGLDSMVIGEPQILGQMKQAFRVAQEAGSLGTHLHKLFQRSFTVAKAVRSGTEVGASSVSMAAASVRLSRRLFENLGECHVLFVGAGEMIELVATHFAAQHPREMVIANRTPARGDKLARKLGASTMPLSELPAQLHRFDVVISCTAAILPIIGLGMVEAAIRQRRRRPMFMVDLAVPRDIEAAVGRLDDVYLHTVDDLGAVIDAGMESRRSAVSQAEAIVDTNADSFMQWLAARRAVPAIRRLHERAARMRQQELERARRSLAQGAPADEVLTALANALSAKFLHGPTSLLNGTPEQQAAISAMVDQLVPDVGADASVPSALASASMSEPASAPRRTRA